MNRSRKLNISLFMNRSRKLNISLFMNRSMGADPKETKNPIDPCCLI
ncbi:hypothetical protein LEP1GSC120_0170 [Leptospira santarosai str. 200702252]|nr:hypothetical protein LEP1GSC130_3419 [Leptospira santarosai str. 200403458]EMO97096.1 hypothetical protein LEP1GSC120_0170 [Leptospira santarosai str. 200702252]